MKNKTNKQDRDKKIQEMQILEQSLQQILMQKQAFQMEISETEAALKELDNSGEDVYKVIGQLMLKADKKEIKKELETKQKLLKTRIDNLDKQEQEFSKKLEKIRNEIIGSDKE
jgi:prefoldin beta subunit